MSIKRMSRIAIMVGIITVCSWLNIPFVVPFTMQTFAVFCSLQLLGGRDSLIALLVYLLLGAAGLPVFSGFRGGLSHLLGPTGGYVFGFLFTAFCYLLLEPVIRRKRSMELMALGSGLLFCYAVGTLWFCVVSGLQGKSYSFSAVLGICVLPYVVPDVLKMLLSRWIVSRIKPRIS